MQYGIRCKSVYVRFHWHIFLVMLLLLLLQGPGDYSSAMRVWCLGPMETVNAGLRMLAHQKKLEAHEPYQWQANKHWTRMYLRVGV
jgi:hypothetical protein